jgi:hypothetical protein
LIAALNHPNADAGTKIKGLRLQMIKRPRHIMTIPLILIVASPLESVYLVTRDSLNTGSQSGSDGSEARQVFH